MINTHLNKVVIGSDGNLYERLFELKDYRRAQGLQHNLPLILIISTMAIMSGYFSIRGIGDFITKHRKDLLLYLKPKKNRLPAFQTISRVMINIDFNKFATIFQEWSMSHLDISEQPWVSLDGKAIGGTVTNPHNKHQEYVNLVSVFLSKEKKVLALDKVNSKSNEIPLVKALIKRLDLENVIFTIDALHCQKETTKVIIESKNDYVIGVKGNQKKLFTSLKKSVENKPISKNKIQSSGRGRKETRTVEIFNNLDGLDKTWVGLKSFIKIERIVKIKEKIRKEVSYYISSLSPHTDPKIINEGIRSHWSIENSLHYVKDKTFLEDASKISKKNAPQNFSIIRNISLNLLRKKGYDNIAQGIRMVANDIGLLWKMIIE